MSADAKEAAFQKDVIAEMLSAGWQQGDPALYDRELALYTPDCIAFVKQTQPKAWEKYTKLYPNDPEKAFIARVALQLNKADPQASNKELRKYGTLGVLRHDLREFGGSTRLSRRARDRPMLLGLPTFDIGVVDVAEAGLVQFALRTRRNRAVPWPRKPPDA